MPASQYHCLGPLEEDQSAEAAILRLPGDLKCLVDRPHCSVGEGLHRLVLRLLQDLCVQQLGLKQEGVDLDPRIPILLAEVVGLLGQPLCLLEVVVLDVQVGKLHHGIRLHAQIVQRSKHCEALFGVLQGCIKVSHLTAEICHKVKALRLAAGPVGLLEELLGLLGRLKGFLPLPHGTVGHRFAEHRHGFGALVAILLRHASGLLGDTKSSLWIPLPKEERIDEVLL
mmetsp:Transcript_41979/g.100059  ORF Transcript_41979/g.100059 Transcript_41979/m.100059 type:complete len:227 (+) Transcript_41979:673-1353(+)